MPLRQGIGNPGTIHPKSMFQFSGVHCKFLNKNPVWGPLTLNTKRKVSAGYIQNVESMLCLEVQEGLWHEMLGTDSG